MGLYTVTGTSNGRKPTVPPLTRVLKTTRGSLPQMLPKPKVFKRSSMRVPLPLQVPRCTSTGTLTASSSCTVRLPFCDPDKTIEFTMPLSTTAYGYSCSKVATDGSELGTLASGFATALRAVSGTRYTTGPICTTIYATSGGSTDYTYDVACVLSSKSSTWA
jgi:hypothetical protein